MTTVGKPDFSAVIAVLEGLGGASLQVGDRLAIRLLTAGLKSGLIPTRKVTGHLGRLSRLERFADVDQVEILRAAASQLEALADMAGVSNERTAAARLTSGESIPAPKKISDKRLFQPGGGVVALMGGNEGDENRPMLVLQSPQWAVRKLFGQNVVGFLGAGSVLNLQTGMHETELEFPGYLLKFILGRTARFIVFDDEVRDARGIVERSYLGRTWGIQRDTLAKSYPKGAYVPDLHAEVTQLEAPFPAVGEGGLWGFNGLERKGETSFESWRIVHLGDQRWRIYESKKYIGDIDLEDYPIEQPKRPTFMEGVQNPETAQIRREALFEGKPMIVPLGSGSGFTQEEASSHLSIDEAGDVTIVDPNVDVVEDLIKLGIPFGRVRRIVVTHVHFDHVAGIWRLLRYLNAKPDLIIHANPDDVKKIQSGTIEDGDEMSTLTALFDMAEKATHQVINGKELLKGVNVVPIKFDQPMSVGTFTERFTLGNHTIPMALGMILDPEGEKPVFLHTGDTRMHHEVLAAATVPDDDGQPVGVIAPFRIDALSNMVSWTLLSGGKVLADAGVSPLHPSVSFYDRMKSALEAVGVTGKALEGVMSRLYLSHAARKDVEIAGFQYAKQGWAGAIDLSEKLGWQRKNPEVIKGQMIEHAIANIPVLANLGIRDVRELIKMGRIKRHRANARLMKDGARAESFSIILDGAAVVSKKFERQNIPLQTLTSGLIGEAVFTGSKKRNADVYASTFLTTLTFGKEAIAFLKRKGIAARLVHRREIMEKASAGPGKVAVLSELSAQTQSDVFLQGNMVRFADGESIIREGDSSRGLYVIFEGDVTISASKGKLAESPVQLGRGDIIGEGTILGGDVRSANVTANGEVQTLFIDEASARQIIDRDGVDLRYYLLGLVQERGSVKSSAPTGGGTPTSTAGSGAPPVPVVTGGGGGMGAAVPGPCQRHDPLIFGAPHAPGGLGVLPNLAGIPTVTNIGMSGILPQGASMSIGMGARFVKPF